MKKYLIEHKKIIASMVIIVFLVSVIILLPSPIGIIQYNTGLTLIGYFGTIIGGIIGGMLTYVEYY